MGLGRRGLSRARSWAWLRWRGCGLRSRESWPSVLWPKLGRLGRLSSEAGLGTSRAYTGHLLTVPPPAWERLPPRPFTHPQPSWSHLAAQHQGTPGALQALGWKRASGTLQREGCNPEEKQLIPAGESRGIREGFWEEVMPELSLQDK